MKKNMGTADRVIRSLIAIGIAVLYFTGRINGALPLVLGAFAIIFLVTSFCPGARRTRHSAFRVGASGNGLPVTERVGRWRQPTSASSRGTRTGAP